MKLDKQTELIALLEKYRERCLWFVRPDYVPASREEWLHTLDLIERYGDMNAFKHVNEAREWLLHPSKAVF
ncbi:MAG TPA: hypothetical protein P5111_12275 [Kiritimatiellia bacterium]|nr:hypothetical protein [Kiritimatiellia bacterium]